MTFSWNSRKPVRSEISAKLTKKRKLHSKHAIPYFVWKMAMIQVYKSIKQLSVGRDQRCSKVKGYQN